MVLGRYLIVEYVDPLEDGFQTSRVLVDPQSS